MANTIRGKTSTLNQNTDSVGVWIIGGRGAVSSSVILGVCAIGKNLIDSTGVVTKTKPFSTLPLLPMESMVFGGHDPANCTLAESVQSLGREAVDPRLVDSLARDLESIESNILPPPRRASEISAMKFVEKVQSDIADFKSRHALKKVVVVNLASTEPLVAPHSSHETLADFRIQLSKSEDIGEKYLPTSALYAYAAMDAGCPYINFTPSTGADLPALDELAHFKKVPYAGRDGKTGETLLKTALAPMFAQRALRVQSWVGYNILGNGDGKSLADPTNAKSKIQSKGAALPEILGYEPFSHVAIDFVPSIGDWKTAVDLIQFQGFFNTPMTFSFHWRGCDSMLAAPLILDLIRLTDFSHNRGEAGALPYLAFFFKNPTACPTHDLSKQYDLLVKHALDTNVGSKEEGFLRTVV